MIKNEGDVVHHQVDVRNTSTQGGLLVAARLLYGAIVTLGSSILLPRQTYPFNFSAGQTNRIDWTFAIPPNTGGQSGVIDVWVEAPDGRLLTPHVLTDLAVNLESGRLGYVRGAPDLNQRLYIQAAGGNGGWFYALKTISISWINTSSAPIAGYIDGVLHSDYNLGDQALTPIAGNGAVVPPGGAGLVTFFASMPGPVIITAGLSSPSRQLDHTGDWDTETRRGLMFGGITAPGGAV